MQPSLCNFCIPPALERLPFSTRGPFAMDAPTCPRTGEGGGHDASPSPRPKAPRRGLDPQTVTALCHSPARAYLAQAARGLTFPLTGAGPTPIPRPAPVLDSPTMPKEALLAASFGAL